MNRNRSKVQINYPEGDDINVRRVVRNISRDEYGNEAGEVTYRGNAYKVERGSWNNYQRWVGQFDN